MASSTKNTRGTTTERAAAGTADWLDERIGVSKVMREFARKIFPDHWSFMLGEVALYSFVILLISGTFLTLWFHPAMGETTYQGAYLPMNGVKMSEAFASTLHLSFDIRGGLLMRQIHHWAALLFIAAMITHMFRVFFTGAFRKPRELNWMIGILLSLMGLAAGFSGYSLPDDMLSGNGLRIIQGVISSIPLVGTYISFFLFGGEFPGTDIVSRLFIVHVMLVPAVLLALIGAHLALVVVHKHTQYPGPGRTENNVVGYPLMPVYMAKAGGFFFVIFGILAFTGAVFSINPVWNYGPYDPSPVSAGTQPDWYIGWIDGALRLMPGPGFEYNFLGHTLTLNVLIPAVGVAGFAVVAALAYPFIEARATGDRREHHLLDRPRNAPTRTGLGVMAIVFYCVAWAAAGNDLMATHFHLSINDLTEIFRVGLFIFPPMAFFLTRRICLSLQRKDRELAIHGRETGVIVRTPDGEYYEVHAPVDKYQRWNLVDDQNTRAPRDIPTKGMRGNELRATRRTNKLSNWFFEERIEPARPSEMHDEDHESGGHDELEGTSHH